MSSRVSLLYTYIRWLVFVRVDNYESIEVDPSSVFKKK